MMNEGAVVYFKMIPQTPSCCKKYSIEQEIAVNPLLKTVP